MLPLEIPRGRNNAAMRSLASLNVAFPGAVSVRAVHRQHPAREVPFHRKYRLLCGSPGGDDRHGIRRPNFPQVVIPVVLCLFSTRGHLFISSTISQISGGSSAQYRQHILVNQPLFIISATWNQRYFRANTAFAILFALSLFMILFMKFVTFSWL